ncbi:beta-1,3-galactosyltransferase 5-like [Heptranchias perlo]|uniref:beta-1,3-galactosyltransferase 5-like n=1 Tax=Heptranchias perlo TaxID=212740 RepID=UPI00355A424B
MRRYLPTARAQCMTHAGPNQPKTRSDVTGQQVGDWLMNLRKLKYYLLLLCSLSALLIPVYILIIRVYHSQRIIQKDAESTSGQLHGFPAIPDSRCDTDPPFLCTLVTTRHEQLEERAAIRETWGKDRRIGERRICTYFLLGYDGAHQSDIERENHLHKDIIQSNFNDTYYNLTIKVLMGMEWVHRFCSSAVFIMKTDSDMFVNTNYLTQLLSVKNTHNFFSGVVFYNWGPIRDKNSKFYVNEEEYPHSKYPTFCSGTGYVFSGDLAGAIWNISRDVPFLKLEDVFVGLYLAKLQVSQVSLSSREVFSTGKVPFSVCRFRSIVTSHWVRPFENRLYWKELEDSTDAGCS